MPIEISGVTVSKVTQKQNSECVFCLGAGTLASIDLSEISDSQGTMITLGYYDSMFQQNIPSDLALLYSDISITNSMVLQHKGHFITIDLNTFNQTSNFLLSHVRKTLIYFY